MSEERARKIKLIIFDVDGVMVSDVEVARGLGVVLLGVGWIYQHVLFPRPPQAATGPDQAQ